MSDFYDRQGRALPMTSWAEMFDSHEQREDYRRVAASTITVDGVEVWVSTVWVGLDHSFSPSTRHIFETMPFGGEHDQEAWRWCSEDHAKIGHVRVVAYLLKEGEEPEQCWGHTTPGDVIATTRSDSVPD